MQTTTYLPNNPRPSTTRARFASLALVLLGLIALPSLALAAPSVSATKAATPPPHVPDDSSARPGDTITYSIGVTNAAGATDATGVTVGDTIDGNSAFVPNSAKVSPNAIAHAYNAAGNTQLSVNTANGLRNGVVDIDGVTPNGSLVVTSGTFGTGQGGSVLINADGSFVYTPQTGDRILNDTFSYTVTDSDGLSSTGLVTITLNNTIVWYVDATAPSGGDGSSAHPFQLLSNVSNGGAGGTTLAINDIIFVIERAGDYNGNLTLLNGQQLYGSGTALTVNTIAINAAGGSNTTFTTTAAATNSITLGQNNTVTGITINAATGAKIVGTNFGTLTISNVTMSGAGQALFLSTGTVNGTIDSLSSSSGTNAVSLATIAGTLTITTGVINGPTSDDFFVNGGAGTISYGGTITNSSGHSVTVQNKTGGTVTFSGAITDTAGSTGISLTTNTGATINFTGGLSLTTTTNAAFAATGGGTVSVTQDVPNNKINTIATTTGTALNIANTTIGASGVTFQSIAANGAVNGIILNNTGAGAFLVSGDGTQTSGLYNRNGTGGTIQSTTHDAVLLTNASNVTLRQMNITNAGWDGVQSTGGSNIVLSAVDINHPGNANPDSAGGTGNPSGFGGGNGWYAENITGTNRFDNNSRVFNWQASQSNGVLIHSTGTNFTSFTVDHVLISTSATAAAGIHGNLNGATTGQVSITNSEFTLIDQNAAQIFNNGSGTVRAIVQGNNFHDADATSGDGNNTLYLTNSADGALNFTIGGAGALGNTFKNLARLTTLAGVIQVDAAGGSAGTPSGGTINGTIENNNISNDVGFVNGRRGIDIQVEMDSHNLGTLLAAIKNNTINNVQGNAIHISTVSVGNGSMTDGNWTITGNNLGTTSRVGLDDTDSSSAIEFETNVDLIASSNAVIFNKLQVANNTCVNSANNATGATLDITNIGGGGASGLSTLNATITSNTLTNQNTAGTGHVLDVLNSSASAHETLNLNITGNNTTLGASLAGEIRLRQLAGTFNIQGGLAAVSANNNNDTVNSTGSFGTVASVPLPTAPGFLIFATVTSTAESSVSMEEPVSASASVGASARHGETSPTTNRPATADNFVLTQAELDSVVAAATKRWAATGLSEQQLVALRNLKFEVGALPSIYLGQANGNRILVSTNAGGNGWFIDRRGQGESAFTKQTSATRGYTEPASDAAGRIDLLTTIMHEMGHAIGLPDSYEEKDRDSLMYGFLTKGERRLPAKGQAIGAIPGSVTGTHFLNLPVTIGTLNPGTSVTMKFQVTVNGGFAGGNITNTANISGSNFVTVNSTTATVPVHVPPAVSTNPTNQATDVTRNATFTAAATGFPVPTVQWFVQANGVGAFNTVPGGTNPTLTITNATAGMNGNVYHAVFTNSAGTATTTDATLTVNPLPTVSPTTLPDSTAGIVYNQTITASNGTGSKTMIVSAYNAGGTGLTAPTASADTLTFNSTPNAAGTVSFDLVATDTVGGSSSSQHYSFVINAAVTFNPATLPDSTVGVLYNKTVKAVGGTGSKTIVVSNYNGTTTGITAPSTSGDTATFNSTPTAPGTVSFDVDATDSVGAAAVTRHYSFTINDVVTLSPTSLPNATVGVNYTQSVTASGGTGNKTMLVANYVDNGPTGLAMPSTSVNTATFNSTPTGAGTVDFDLKATDTVGASTTVHYTITVAPPCDNPATVTSTLDDGSAGTLRYELNKVCDGGVVNFQAGVTGTITLTTGQLEIDKNVTVTGPGAAVVTVTANNSGRVFNVQSGKTVTISGLTISGGNVLNANQGGLGGSIYVNSTASLTLTNCVVSGNKALDTNGGGAGAYNGGTLILLGTTFSGNQSTIDGGAIRNDGTLSLTDSTLDNNTAGTTGGAIQNGGSLTIYSSTLSNNTAAGDGGAVRNDGTQFTITNSTLSGNKTTGAGADGGAILNAIAKTLTITNATIVKNTAGHDGGGINNGGTLNIKNSIVALNTATNSAPDLKGSANVDYSLLGDSTGAGTITGGNNLSGDPKLNNLGDYGGPTLTHQPKIDSPVMDAGNNAFVTAPPFPMPFKDQRGFDRIVDSPDVGATATVDIGAVEANYSINVVSGSTPQSATVGTQFAIPLAAKVSESGNPIGGVTVTWAAPGTEPTGSFAGPATAVTDNTTGIATPPAFTASNTAGGPYTVSATAAGYAGSADYSLTNTPGTATQLIVTAPPNATAGSAFTVTVTAKDQFGNTNTTYTGTIHFTSTDGGPTLPGDYTFVAGDNGTHPFTAPGNGVTFVTAGTQTLTVTDAGNSLTGFANVNVAAAAATKLAYSVQPSSTTAGATISPAVKVVILDAFNNVVTTSSANVGLVIANNPSAGTLSGTTPVAAVNGVATFSDLSINKAGTGYTLTASSGGLTSVTSNGFNIGAGAATHFTVVGPASTTAGTAFNVTVTALDAANNIATGYTSTIHFTSTDSQAALPVDYTFLAGDNGSKTFSAMLKTAGNQTITATDTVNAAITGTSSTINVIAGAATHYALLAPGAATPGTPFNFTVTALDQFNNTATSYLGTTHFTSSNAATVPGDYTFIAGDNGSHIFSATLNNTGNQSITATDTVTPTITGTANLSGGQAPSITSANNATFKVATAGTFTVTTTGFPTNASMVITETGALPGNLTFTNNNNGTATLAGTPNAGTGGTYSISIKASNGIAPDATQSFTLTVLQGPAFTSTDHTTFAEGTAGTFTVTTTGFPTGPNMSITRTGNLPAGVTFVNNDDGTATLSGTPALFTRGTYPFTIGANNGVTATVNQSFTLTVTGTVPLPTPTATATATATPTATATATATPTATATATATPTASATATPTATPTVTPAQALNISTRLRVDTGDKVMIGGFIITGNVAKPVVLRGIGPSLVDAGIPAASVLNDPVLELHGASGALITSNDNWKDSPQRAQIEGTLFQPTDDREAVIVATLPPAAYTVVLKGAGNTTGVGLVEMYDDNRAVDSALANISTRGFVRTGNEVMIGGFVLGGNNLPTRIAVRALGPSLTNAGLTSVMADPTLELHNANGTIMISNDDWQSDATMSAQLTANGLGLPDPKECGIFTSLAPPGQFTAIVAGKNGGIGIALVEIYNLK